MQSPFPLRRFLWIVFAGALLAAIYAHFQHGAPAIGALVGSSIGAAIFALERFVLRRNSGAVLRRLPFFAYFVLRSALYVGILLLINELANRFASPEGRFVPINQVDILASISVCVGGNLLISVNDLLGPGVLFDFAAGRYYHPRREERVLLLIDMPPRPRSRNGWARRGSSISSIASSSMSRSRSRRRAAKSTNTSATRSSPPGRWRPGRTKPAVCAPVSPRSNASPRAAPITSANCACAPISAPGCVCGPLVVGELGYLKKEIALIGDAMNTAARILEACRETGCRVLASATLLERLTALPPGVAARALGPLPMRGKDRALELYALETSGVQHPQPTLRKSFSSSVA